MVSQLCARFFTFSHFKHCRHDRYCLTQALPWLCFYASRIRYTMTLTWPQVEADALRQIAMHFDMPVTNKTYTLQTKWRNRLCGCPSEDSRGSRYASWALVCVASSGIALVLRFAGAGQIAWCWRRNTNAALWDNCSGVRLAGS